MNPDSPATRAAPLVVETPARPEPSRLEACRVCRSRHFSAFPVREMMRGDRSTFAYGLCRSCECLFRIDEGVDLHAYYAGGYYSFGAASRSAFGSLRRRALRALIHAASGNDYLASRLWNANRLCATLLPYLTLVRSRQAAILDVGSGAGASVRDLHDLGYRNAIGLDPYVEGDLDYKGRKLVAKGGLADARGLYDLIGFSHSLEHMDDHVGVLRQAGGLLAKDGAIFVRTPIAGSRAFEHYRGDWVQLDAPRHLILHSIKSLHATAKEAALQIEKIVYDSWAFQCWGSEMYRSDVALADASPAAIFPARRMRDFRRYAAAANRDGRGDQIFAVLRAARTARG